MDPPERILRKDSAATTTGSDYGAPPKAAIVIRGDRLTWLGPEAPRPRAFAGEDVDPAVSDISDPSELSYWAGHSLLHTRYVGGERRPRRR